MFNYSNIKVGADPEIFYIDAKGVPKSAEGLIGGSKAEPKRILDHFEGYFVQEDNVSAEFNIPPATNSRDFSNSINRVLKYLKKVGKDKDLTAAFVSSLHFPKDQLMTEHAQTLGCEPDFNAWTKEQNPRPRPPETLRTAAGHVHVGWDSPEIEERALLLKTLDLFLGVPSIVASEKNERRALYGKAGACRLKPYGVEYRVLDNFWIRDHLNREYVFDQVLSAVRTIRKQKAGAMGEMLDDYSDMIVNTINEHDQDSALRLCTKFNIPLFPVFANAKP